MPNRIPKQDKRRISSIIFVVVIAGLLMPIADTVIAKAKIPRRAETLEEQIKSLPPEHIASVARERGDARRGAIIFYTSAAGCVNCHVASERQPALAPDLAMTKPMSDRHLVESLTHPSRVIREGYETHYVLMDDGSSHIGNIKGEDEKMIQLVTAATPPKTVLIPKQQIESRKTLPVSGMPEGLLSTFQEQRDFMDLLRYLMAISEGGKKTEEELRPELSAITNSDDVADLDHATIIKKLRSRDFETGEKIFQGYCFGCHGRDGNQPSLPTARAFGKDKMKFGSDPHSMFQTLSTGNGLMAPMRHLTPKERYQVIHYVREAFMKPSNPDYFEITDSYLETLPKGSRLGDERIEVTRNFKPALGSQLGREFPSVLSIPLGKYSIAYNLHTMNLASVWEGEFVDVSETQHARDRGEGTVTTKGKPIPSLSAWKWGHQQQSEYPTSGLLPRGPLPSQWMDYQGYYRHGEQVILSYEIDQRPILEMPVASANGITQHLEIGAGKEIRIIIGDATTNENAQTTLTLDGQALHQASIQSSQKVDAVVNRPGDNDAQLIMTCHFRGNCEKMVFEVDSQKRIIVHIPESDTTRRFRVTRLVANQPNTPSTVEDPNFALHLETETVDLRSKTKGSESQWPQAIETTGFTGLEQKGYAVDTLTIPDANPWNSWLRTSALDFFSDGRMAVSTYGGDVWIVSGIDSSLRNLKWKRFAAGLYEPFGLRVVNDLIYVTCKDRLVRLHDLNQDSEADFYESFSAEPDVSVNFHAFSFDLQTDSEGNFYYAKSGHGSDSTLPGMIYKISSDGKKREVLSTGFRTPNGLGMMPGNRLVGSDNQGQWMPASKINHLKSGRFYGWVPTYSIPGMWEPDGGNLDLKKVIAPTSFEPPIVWMPQEFDNSSGGQLWVDDQRFGPLDQHLLHTSFGKGWMSYLMTQEINGLMQGAIIRLPLNFRTGVMRARTNPLDGQVYATGLQGWNGGGRIGLRENGIQRLRYTGNPNLLITDCKVIAGGLELTFNQAIAPSSIKRAEAFSIQHWNYHWRHTYGSAQYRPSDDQEGVETLRIESVSWDPKRMTVTLQIPELIPVDQLHLRMNILSNDGSRFEEEIYWTIHHTLHAEDSE